MKVPKYIVNLMKQHQTHREIADKKHNLIIDWILQKGVPEEELEEDIFAYMVNISDGYFFYVWKKGSKKNCYSYNIVSKYVDKDWIVKEEIV